jgi:uncharacterized integral membrane protein (TIGR00697 family)
MADQVRPYSIDTIKPFPHYLWILVTAYSMMVAITNWFDARLILIFGISLPPGAIAFPITLLLSDIITEVYGYKHARRAIWAAFFFNLIFLLYGQAILLFPSPVYVENIEALDKLLHTNIRIFIAAFFSYLISEPVNSCIVSKLKMMMKGRYMGIRFVASTIISGLLDSIIFISIAFYGIFEFRHIIGLILSIWMVKVIIEIIGLPFSISLSKFLKKREGLDIYDYGTKFNLFRLDVNYKSENNLYKERGEV